MEQMQVKEKQKSWRYVMSLLLMAVAVIAGGQRVLAADTADAAVTQKKPKVYMEQTEVTMYPATTKTLKLHGASSKSKIKWSSSSKKTATVKSSGKVTAKAQGTATITATYKSKEYTCIVNVTYGTRKTSDGMKYKDTEGSFGYTGRWFKKSISGGKYYFTNTDGSAVYFKVTGSKYVNVNFVSKISAQTPYFAYSVDGGSMKRQLISSKKISVGNTKTHYVRLVIDAISENENRWGEAGVGIKSIKPVTSSGAVTAVTPQNDTIAFYGDSITQGVRALNMALAPSGTSATHSYAWYCADKLNMVPYFAGYGGSGIAEAGCFNSLHNAISSFSMGRKASSYDADVIVFEHGTNDVHTYGDIFINEYKKALQMAHKAHPKAKVMVIIPFTQIHADEIRKAAAPYKKWCTVIETSSWRLSYTDGLHPNTSGAKTAGKNLAKTVAAKRKAS